MSSTDLKLIPILPSYIPDEAKQADARSFLNRLYQTEQVTFYNEDTIEFIDPGSNFESVVCNLCGQPIEVEDWQSAMDKAYEKQFTDLKFTTSCCHKETSLNDLNYTWAAGFAKFIIVVSGAQETLSASNLKTLEESLGTPVRCIWAHY